MAPARRLTFLCALAAVGLAAAACGSSNSASSTGTTAPTTKAPGTTAAPGKSTSSASSDQLKTWQTDLNAVGCDAGPVDGIDGGETEAAIRNFQYSAGLTVDGTMGPQTEAALTKDAAAGTQVCQTTPGTSVATTSTTASSASPSSTTTSTTTPVTVPNGTCPGPGCVDYSISPSSGPAGTTITVHSVSGVCTITGAIGLNPTSPPGPSIAQGSLTAQGVSQYVGTVTVPTGTTPGAYLVESWTTGAQVSAGLCQATFTVTG
jgi:peptidoglycan hydrolase-like protein with peptidoglycan-binding domain